MSNHNEINVIFYKGLRKKLFCDYCKQNNPTYNYGMSTTSLTAQVYQDMIDRGWRRSGKYCYKSSMNKSCCPLYTIRCDAIEFKISKSQKKVIKKITRFIRNRECHTNICDTEKTKEQLFMNYKLHDKHNQDDTLQTINTDQLYVEQSVPQNSNVQVTNRRGNTIRKTKKVKPGEGANPNLPKSKNKKLQRMEKKLSKKNIMITTMVAQKKSLEDFIEENDFVSTIGLNKLRVSLVRTDSKEFEQTFAAGAALFAKYQIAIHNNTPNECNAKEYNQFLVDSPIQAEKADHSDHPGYGSFHQQYWLEDKLIAVGVIDILPICVTSVYSFYDPDYHHLSLGTYSLLREIYLVRHLYSMSPDLKYYYMGFYVHSSSKMNYKAKFQPSFLLCPLQYTWHTVEKCIERLDNEKYSVFDDSDDIHGDDSVIDNIPILYDTLMTYSEYKIKTNKKNDNRLCEYAMLVGQRLANQLIYSF